VSEDRKTYAWSGTARELLDAPKSIIEEALDNHLKSLLNMYAAGSQVDAWSEEIDVLRTGFRDLAIARPDCLNWGIVLEYELPLEGGRRPDVIITAPNKILVFEFKQDPSVSRAQIDQVYAYSRDLMEYHSKSHDVEVLPYLIPTKTNDIDEIKDGVRVVSPNRIAPLLSEFEMSDPIELDDWISGDYAPLPSLIQAAKMIFQNENLPSIRRAKSLGVDKAVVKLQQISSNAKKNEERVIAFVAGVPGAGKTLVGLQFVYESSTDQADSIFLSGNGPLVEVLRDALQNKTFVKDLHGFIKSYGMTAKIPPQHIIVFDEAQRAWDAKYMELKNGVPFSEPELLIKIGEKLPTWANLVGLIGQGQEIYSGEEAGIAGWNAAVTSKSATSNWKIYGPERFAVEFPESEFIVTNELDLNKSLRSRRAEDLHDWVANLLEGNLSIASRLSQNIIASGFQILITRDLDIAKQYIRERYKDQPNSRFGILASSKDLILTNYGIKNNFHDVKQVKKAKWYNSPEGEKFSSNNLEDAITEFDCQGLEVDCGLVCWGNDFLWNGDSWEMRKMRSQYKQDDPHSLRKNSYRVLLTRSRDEMVIFVPGEDKFDKTEFALLAAGAKILQLKLDLAI
jgi:DUF2075 family protein